MVAPTNSSPFTAVMRCNVPACDRAGSYRAWRCPRHGSERTFPTGIAPPARDAIGPRREKRANVCVFGHAHDSKGEATCCPLVHEAAFQAGGYTVFIPGRPGVPCFTIDPHVDTWRPVYVSADWILVDGRKPALIVDYKGSVAKGKRFDKGWARGRRILETELGVRCVELKTPESAIELVKSALSRAAGGAS